MSYETSIDALISDYIASDREGESPRPTLWSAEQALRAGKALKPSLNVTWVLNVRAVDEFVAGEQRLPRSNSRTDMRSARPHEARLADWLRHQRGRRAELHVYKVERLELAPWFSWEPLADLWDEKLCAYREFLDSRLHAPRRESSDPAERALAVWARNQRAAFRAGALSQHRITELVALPAWRWNLGLSPRR